MRLIKGNPNEKHMDFILQMNPSKTAASDIRIEFLIQGNPTGWWEMFMLLAFSTLVYICSVVVPFKENWPCCDLNVDYVRFLWSLGVWGGWSLGPRGPDVAATPDSTAQRFLAENGICFFIPRSFLFFPPGSRKHQLQTWVGSKCSLNKPTTLRNGRPNSSP